MIYISTGGYKNQAAISMARKFYEHGILNTELSGGIYIDNVSGQLKELPSDLGLQIHNYFPPPKIPFVLNLASDDDCVAKLSYEHVRNSMQLCSDAGLSHYSFHAGFRLDLKVDELGKKILMNKLVDRSISLKLFIDRIFLLSKEAERLGVKILVENNVLTMHNFNQFNDNPLLLVEPDEIQYFFSLAPSNVRLLLDVAHLKVSSVTLGFDMIKAHNSLFNEIEGYHLSDNNGLIDSNHKLTQDSWFWSHINKKLNYYTLEIYNASIPDIIGQYKLASNKLFL
jgi:sugar phosphate isomerase/epimerase